LFGSLADRVGRSVARRPRTDGLTRERARTRVIPSVFGHIRVAFSGGRQQRQDPTPDVLSVKCLFDDRAKVCRRQYRPDRLKRPPVTNRTARVSMRWGIMARALAASPTASEVGVPDIFLLPRSDLILPAVPASAALAMGCALIQLFRPRGERRAKQ
jgi:hypothetical protein